MKQRPNKQAEANNCWDNKKLEEVIEDVEEYNSKKIHPSVPEIMDAWKEVYKKKESDYGESWLKTGKILEILFDGKPINLNSTKDFNTLALIVRTIDKLCRYTNVYFSKKGDSKVNETLAETAGDNQVYWAMLSSLSYRDDD